MFLLAVVTLRPFAIYSQTPVSLVILVSLLVCLIPTTIGGLLSAIGIAGMDRLVQRNVLAMSGRAVEAAGDIDVLLLDKTGTITIGNRMASDFIPADGVNLQELAEGRIARFGRRSDSRRADRSLLLANQKGVRAPKPAGAEIVPFTAETRMSGIDIEGASIRKGAKDAMEAWVAARAASWKRGSRPCRGDRP